MVSARTAQEKAIAVYTSKLDHGEHDPEPQIMMQDRLSKGRERLENAQEAIALVCEPVEQTDRRKCLR